MATYYRWRQSNVNFSSALEGDITGDLGISASSIFFGSEEPVITNDGYFDLSSWNNRTLPVELGGGRWFSSPQKTKTVFEVNTSSTSHNVTISKNSGNLFSSGPLLQYRVLESPSTLVGYVYSTSSSAYPNGGVKGDYYYDQRTTVTSPTAASGLTYPATITTPSVSISWTAATSNVPNYTVNLYEVSYSTNNGDSWTVAGTTAETSYSFSVPAGTTSIMFRVRARDSNNQYGAYVTGTASQVLLSPTLTVPQMVMQGQSATISWSAISGADSYTLQRKSSADADWTQVYSGANLSYTETVGTWTSLQYRVQAVFDETPGGWATSDSIQIVAASALVISGTDGDLGALTSDVQYSVSSDQTGNTISVSVEVNGGEYAEFTATSGQTYSVGVLDLPTGTGNITITATTTVSSSPVSVTRSWTYTKTAQTFPSAGSIGRLTQEGAVVWPETLAEAVRAGTPWGGNLSTALELLKKAALYNRTQTPKYNEVNINLATATVGQIINLPVNGVMTPHRVVHIGNPDPELYDASCDGVWMWRQDTDESGAWSTTNSNVLPNSAIMQAMAGLLDNYDSTIQGAIKTVKIPYGVGGDSSAVNSGANGLECKIFPLGGYEVGFTDEGTTFIPEDGAKLAYFEAGLGTSANSKRIAKLNGSNYNYWLRSSYYGGTGDYGVASYSVSATGARGPNNVSATMAYCNAFILPTTFSSTYYVDNQGTIHASQEYTEAGDWLDVWGNTIPAVRIETGSYVGTGTSGQNNPTTLTFSFEPKILFIKDCAETSYAGVVTPAIYPGEGMGVINPSGTIGYATVQWSENSVSWFSNDGSAYQLNGSGTTYSYLALG